MMREILFLILLSLPFRLYHLTYPILDAFNFRQAQTATFALNFYKNGINLFQTELDIFGLGRERYMTLEFPLYEAVVAIFYKIFFVSDIWGRVVSILAGYLAAYYLYRLTQLLTNNKKIPFFSVFFFLFTPLNMFYQRSFMIEPLIIFLLLAASFYFCQFVKKRDNKSYSLAIIFLTLGFIHKGLYGPFWLLPMIVYYIKKGPLKKISARKFILLLAIPLLSLFLWQSHVNYMNKLAAHTFFTSESLAHLEWNFGLISDRLSLSLWDFRLRQVLNGILLKPGLVLFFVGLVFVFKRDKSRFFVSLLLSQIIYFTVLFRIQQQNYYQMVMIPSFSVIMSYGLVAIYERINSQSLKLLLVLLFATAYIYKSWMNTLPSFYIDGEWYRRLIKVGEVVSQEKSGILVTPHFDWNSVYTYIPKKKMLLIPVEKFTPESLIKWQALGYSFVVLHEYEKYDLNFIEKYRQVLNIPEFKVYQM